MLTADMRRVVREQRLGFVATVNADGTPNVSPKATFVVLDDSTIGFGDMVAGYSQKSEIQPRGRGELR